MKKRLVAFVFCFMVIFLSGSSVIKNDMQVVNAHSGRTDSSGGHKDNKNASGLGSYHYHCDGNPPHLHDNGCPYSGEGEASGYQAPAAQSPAPSVPKEQVQIANQPSELKVGDNLNLGYSIENATDDFIKVESSDSNIVLVNSDNTLKAVSTGEVIIKVSSTKDSKSFKILVITIPATAIEVSKTSLTIAISGEEKVESKVIPENATNAQLSWISSNEAIVKVKEDGTIQGIGIGKTTVIVSNTEGINKEVVVEVTPIYVETIKIDTSKIEYLKESEHTISKDKELDLSVILEPENATFTDVVWSSSNEKVIEVVDNVPQIIGSGEVVLTATAEEGVKDSIELSVVDEKESSIGAAIVIFAILLFGATKGRKYLQRFRKR